MAKRTKKSQTEATDEDVTDAIVTEEVGPETEDKAPDEPITSPDPVEDMASAEIPEPEPQSAPDPIPEPEVVRQPEPSAAPVYKDTNRENNVLLPMILGGLIAAGIGYGAAYLQRPVIDVPLEEQVAIQANDIAALQAVVAEPIEMPDMTPLNDQIATLRDESAGRLDAIDTRIAEIDTRLDAVEKQPSADGTLQETAIAAFQRELDELREQTEQMSADAAAALQATREEASAIEQNAIDNARAATARAALARVQAALETGAAFGDILPDLADAVAIPIPVGLTAAADGIPTLGQLQADFPATARTALSAARSDGADGSDGGGITGFLRNQLNVRSVTPQEGDGVDAVLSRAEAALKAGRLNETMTEIATLPEGVRGTMSDWLARAEKRVVALEAVETLSQSINDK